MAAQPVVVELPFLQTVLKVRIGQVGQGIEFIHHGLLCLLHLAVEVGRTGLDRPEFDGPVHQALLDLVSEKLAPPIGLNSLDRERHLLYDPVQEIKGVGRRAPRIDADNHEPGAVVNGRILVQAGPQLHGVHLDPVARDRTLIALEMSLPPESDQRLDLAPIEDLVNRGQGNLPPVAPNELALDSSRAKLLTFPEAHDPLFMFLEYLPVG